MSRRGERVEEYEERSYYERDEARSRPAPVRARDLLEIDINTRRDRERDRQPEFLRQEYVRTEDQPLVLRRREVETVTRPIQRRSPSPVERERVRTRIVGRERERSPSPVEREVVRTRVVERGRDRSPEPERYRTRIIEKGRSISPGDRLRTRVVERDTERLRRDSSLDRVRTTTTTRTIERERSPSPVRERETIRTRVVERERSESSDSSPSPPLEPPVIRAPPIHQELITHHRHIDHGYEYAAAPLPPPSITRTRPRETDTEIDIYKGKHNTEIDIHTTTKRSGREEVREGRPARDFYDDDVLVERDRERLHVRESHNSRRRSLSARHRSVSARRDKISTYETEEDYYARKAKERAYIGEAYNGVTKDWAIVDVPPGTERVRMDGVGGASQEITWQRYNGVRRSKFIPERDSLAIYEREEVTDRRVALPPKNKYGDMWTEITKDLVVREAIEEIGYDYEETEYFFYIFQYLKYEDIQELVFLTDDIRKARQSRIREIAYERERMKERDILDMRERKKDRDIVDVKIERTRTREPAYDEERIIERDVTYDETRRRRYR